MGADKNSSPKREPGLYPKFTTKDFHTSLPRSRSHNGPTNPRNTPQTIPKRKHDSRSKGLRCPATTLVDIPRPWGGRSAITGRTVRGHRADGPLPTGGRSVNRNRTTKRAPNHTDGPYLVLGRSTSNTCRANGLRPLANGPALTQTVRDPYVDGPTNPFRPEPDGQTNRNEDAQEHATNMKNHRPKSSARTIRGL
jgi:hypothetical protein